MILIAEIGARPLVDRGIIVFSNATINYWDNL